VPAGRQVTEVVIPCPLRRAELPALFERTCELLARERCELLVCEVGGVAADAVAVDALARLALAARRNGCEVRLRSPSRELLALVELIGLAGVLHTAPPELPGAGL
jgi:ABC-type transporter Mla MlaB component